MFQIKKHRILAPGITRFEVEAEKIACKARAGQFVIVRLDERGERIPLTIACADPVTGCITLVVQDVGFTTHQMCNLQTGDYFIDVVGPLGKASEIEAYGNVVCIGGGVGVAPVYPIAVAMAEEAGNTVTGIIGARSADLVIMAEEMAAACQDLYIYTDDGSSGHKGTVVDALNNLLTQIKPDLVMAIGPLRMMQAVCEFTREHGIATRVSMNPIMVDGTGMCGACRVLVDGKTKFACVHGPEFDGHQVDWDTALTRSRMFKHEEQLIIMAEHAKGGECQCQKK